MRARRWCVMMSPIWRSRVCRPREVARWSRSFACATRNAFVHGSRPLGDIDTFLRVEGEVCRDITLTGNDLHRCQTAVQTADGATQSALAPATPLEGK